MATQMSKQDLRRQMLGTRKAIEPEKRQVWNQLIETQLLHDDAWKTASSAMAYCSFPDEVETAGILKAVLNQGKRLFLPRRIKGEKRFEAVEVRDLDKDIAPTSFHSLVEPLPELDSAKDPDLIDMIIIPGIAFDRRGFRIGFGAGMYDRFLASAPAPYRVALAYAVQVIEEVPADDHDMQVHSILTEEGWIDARRLA